MQDKLKLSQSPDEALISYSRCDGRTIFATHEIFGVSVNVTLEEMKKHMDNGLKFAEVEDSTCVIGFETGAFGSDVNYIKSMNDAAEMRDVVRMYGMPEAISIWDERNGR